MALAERIAIGHVHGGETAPGIWDEQIRHAITKMAHVHFCATEKMFDRVSVEAFPFPLFRYAHFCAFARRRRTWTVVAGLGDRLGRIRCRRNRVGFSTVFVDFSSAASPAATTGIPSMRIIVHAPCDKFEGSPSFRRSRLASCHASIIVGDGPPNPLVHLEFLLTVS